MSEMNSVDALTAKVIRQRRTGYTFEEIAEREGMAVAEVVDCWQEYVKSRTVMDLYEWRTLHELRLEHMLVMLNERIEQNLSGGKIDDFRNMTVVMDQIEKLHALNTERQEETAEMLRQISVEQGKVIAAAIYAGFQYIKAEVEQAFENGRTIKAIRAEVADVLDNRALPIAQKALEGAGPKEEQP